MHFTIVSYSFPPSTDIGGRRWAKFSQYISRNGHDVTVVCADHGDFDSHADDFRGIQITRLPKRYPGWLKGYTTSFLEKLLYKLYTQVLSPLVKQNLFDEGYAWKKIMLHALENIHSSKKIDVLIVTGAPFSLCFFGSIFKAKHLEVKYVVDLRDPWTWGSYYGIPFLSQRKKKFQEESERFTVNSCDVLSYPTKNMGDFLKAKYPDRKDKLYLLPHAYEPERFPALDTSFERRGFIYGGTLYDGIEDYLKKLISVIQSSNIKDFKWDIYTNTHYPLLSSGSENIGITIHGFIPENELFKRIRQSAAYLAFFPPADKDLISTKFFEIIYSETPILYIGEEGDVAKFVRENKLGVHILPENIEKELPRYLSGNVPFEKDFFNVTHYTFEAVTKYFLEDLSLFPTSPED